MTNDPMTNDELINTIAKLRKDEYHPWRYILFTFLNLEGMQAGLNWLTILKKRKSIEKAFYHFDPKKIVRSLEKNFHHLMGNSGIIRNKLKIMAVLHNARAYLELMESDKMFSTYLWQFVEGQPIKNNYRRLKNVPAQTKESQAMSKDLKKRGFRFVGPTICYAFMQAIGMVNDHLVTCFRYHEV